MGTAVAMFYSAPAGAAPEGEWEGLSVAERQDLTLIAESEGIGTDEAMDRVAWQNDFAMAATAVQAAYPESFAHAEITSEVPAVGSISFVGSVPVDAHKLLISVPEGVKVELIPGAELSAAAVDAAIIDVHHAVSATGLVGDVTTSYDDEAGLVRVAAQPKSEEDGETAYGYHQGSVGSGCGFLGLSSCDVWSRASYIDEALNVSVRSN